MAGIRERGCASRKPKPIPREHWVQILDRLSAGLPLQECLDCGPVGKNNRIPAWTYTLYDVSAAVRKSVENSRTRMREYELMDALRLRAASARIEGLAKKADTPRADVGMIMSLFKEVERMGPIEGEGSGYVSPVGERSISISDIVDGGVGGEEENEETPG